MDVYMDLSLLYLLIEIMVCIKGIEILLCYRIKRRVKISLIIVNLLMFFTIYLSFFINLIAFLLINLLIFLIFNKKWLYDYLIFNILFFMINFLLSFSTSSLAMLHIYIVIKKPLGALYILLIPLFGVFLIVSSKFVDSIFHLHQYKTTCFISKEKRKVYYKAFYDSGNLLKVNDVPVIFILKSVWNFSFEGPKDICVNTINGEKNYVGYGALLSIEDSPSSYFVYVVLMDEENLFHGCEVLLNAYLR